MSETVKLFTQNYCIFNMFVPDTKKMFENTLDTPVPRHFDNGWYFPLRIRISGFILIAFGLFSLLTASYYIGAPLFVLGLFIAFTFSGVRIDTTRKRIIEYTRYLGFIHVTKSYSYEQHHYVTAIPTRVSQAVNANLVQQTVETSYRFTVCLLTENFRRKKELMVITSKSEAEHLSNQLAHLLEMEYFEYDPQAVRAKLTGR